MVLKLPFEDSRYVIYLFIAYFQLFAVLVKFSIFITLPTFEDRLKQKFTNQYLIGIIQNSIFARN